MNEFNQQPNPNQEKPKFEPELVVGSWENLAEILTINKQIGRLFQQVEGLKRQLEEATDQHRDELEKQLAVAEIELDGWRIRHAQHGQRQYQGDPEYKEYYQAALEREGEARKRILENEAFLKGKSDEK